MNFYLLSRLWSTYLSNLVTLLKSGKKQLSLLRLKRKELIYCLRTFALSVTLLTSLSWHKLPLLTRPNPTYLNTIFAQSSNQRTGSTIVQKRLFWRSTMISYLTWTSNMSLCLCYWISALRLIPWIMKPCWVVWNLCWEWVARSCPYLSGRTQRVFVDGIRGLGTSNLIAACHRGLVLGLCYWTYMQAVYSKW